MHDLMSAGVPSAAGNTGSPRLPQLWHPLSSNHRCVGMNEPSRPQQLLVAGPQNSFGSAEIVVTGWRDVNVSLSERKAASCLGRPYAMRSAPMNRSALPDAASRAVRPLDWRWNGWSLNGVARWPRRVKRLAKRRSALVGPNPWDSMYFLDRTNWLPLVPESLFWELAGTISGTLSGPRKTTTQRSSPALAMTRGERSEPRQNRRESTPRQPRGQ